LEGSVVFAEPSEEKATWTGHLEGIELAVGNDLVEALFPRQANEKTCPRTTEQQPYEENV